MQFKKTTHSRQLFGSFRLTKAAQAYHLVFLVRRYAMILILMFLPGKFLQQILWHLALTSVVVLYVALNGPFENHSLNSKEIVNELMVALAAYPILMFSGWANREREKV